jgi:hypothetical protein
MINKIFQFLELPISIKTIDEKVTALCSFTGFVLSLHLMTWDSLIGFILKCIGACVVAILSAYFGKLGLDIYKQFPCSKIYVIIIKYIPSIKTKTKKKNGNNNRN